MIVERDETDIVVVVAELLQLGGGALPHRIEWRRVGKQRIAPSEQNVRPVALGDMMGLIDPGTDFREREAIRRVLGAGRAPGQQRRSEQSGGGRHAERAAHHVAAVVAPLDEVADGIAGDRAERNIVVGLKGLGPVAECVGFRHMRGSISV